MKQQELETG
jgi:hypothetical protein